MSRIVEYENLKKLNEQFVDEYHRVFAEVLDSGWFILGNRVKEFENSFALYTGSSFCAGVASGLDAIHLALDALDLAPGDEVIVPSNTYIATILAVVNAGLTPVLAEPDLETCNISPEEIRKNITPKTKAIIVVHLYGKACEMDKITDICAENNLFLIEDCAQSHGASYKGQQTGTFGDFGAFSFYPTKNLGALGDGGAITTKNPEFIDRIRYTRNYGSKVKYYNEFTGYNSRLDEIQAAFLSVKLRHLDSINNHKRRLAELYLSGISDSFIKPVVHPDYHDVYHIFQIRHPERDKLREFLQDKGIKTEIHYPVPPHKQHAYRKILAGAYPVSEEIHSTTLSLPISYFHSTEDIIYVIETLNKFPSR